MGLLIFFTMHCIAALRSENTAFLLLGTTTHGFKRVETRVLKLSNLSVTPPLFLSPALTFSNPFLCNVIL